MGKLDKISWKMVACIKVISHVSIAFKNGVGMDGFQCCLSEISRANLVSILICRVISANSMWCGGHVWHLAVRVGELVWLQIVPFVCRFVDLSEVADPAHWSWLSPTTDFRQGRKAFLMTPPEFWLTYIACVYLDCLLQGLRFNFFGNGGTHQLSSHDAGDFFIFEDQSCSPCFVGFSPICLGNFGKKQILREETCPWFLANPWWAISCIAKTTTRQMYRHDVRKCLRKSCGSQNVWAWLFTGNCS